VPRHRSPRTVMKPRAMARPGRMGTTPGAIHSRCFYKLGPPTATRSSTGIQRFGLRPLRQEPRAVSRQAPLADSFSRLLLTRRHGRTTPTLVRTPRFPGHATRRVRPPGCMGHSRPAVRSTDATHQRRRTMICRTRHGDRRTCIACAPTSALG